MHVNLSYFWRKKTLLSFLAIPLIIVIHNSTIALYPPSLDQNFFTSLANIIHNFFAYNLGAIAVPLFFFMSGFAFFRNFKPSNYTKKIRSRIGSLLIPYLIWNTFGLLIIILFTYTPLSSFISGRELFEPSTGNVLEGIFLYKYNFQYWFIFDLMIYTILTPIIYLVTSKRPIGIITLIVALFIPNFIDSFLGLNLNFTIFYILGCYLGKHHLAFFTNKSSRKLSVYSGLAVIVLLTIRALTFYQILNLPIFISNLLLLLLLISVWFSSDLIIDKIKPKAYFNEFFPLYTLHTYFLAICSKLLFYFLPIAPFSLFINEILSTIITFILATLVSYTWHQKLPKAYRLAFGSRKKLAR